MTDRMHHPFVSMLLLAVFAAGCREHQAVTPSCCAETATGAPLPDTSVYQLTHDFEDQTGATRHLEDFRGRPIVLAMIFTHRSFACPAIIADIQRLLAKIPGRHDVHVVLASMDAKRDTPAALAAFAKLHSLPAERFTLLHGSAFAVQELAAVLGMRYAEVEGGDFSHSNLLTLLDHAGRVHTRHEGLSADPQPLVDGIAALPMH